MKVGDTVIGIDTRCCAFPEGVTGKIVNSWHGQLSPTSIRVELDQTEENLKKAKESLKKTPIFDFDVSNLVRLPTEILSCGKCVRVLE